MRERPILFSAPMVRAILAGTKTATRRLVRGDIAPHPNPQLGGVLVLTNGRNQHWVNSQPDHPQHVSKACPYGGPGDRLWVRESFRLRADQDSKPPSEDWWKSGASWYEADGKGEPSGCGGGMGKLRPGIHMPRWASRVTLEVTAVRVERLQDISASDALAEGVVDPAHGWDGNVHYPRAQFAELWDSINGKRCPWKSNPWLWVVSFKRVAQEAKAA